MKKRNIIVNICSQYPLPLENFEKNKKDLQKLIEDINSDKEIKEIARIELDQLIKDNELNEKKIKLFLLPKDDADSKNAIIEIRAGTGGLEASLFASDLFKMYEKISHKKKNFKGFYSISNIIIKEIFFSKEVELCLGMSST